jgi:hypothetical protein
VVINEVMANPVGPEPQQEWLELYNDGSTDVELGGWMLEDAGAAVELPAATVRPGRFALVVAERYDPDSWVDTPAAPGTVLVRVPSLGKAGLSNSGEPIRLRSPDGSASSVVPAVESREPGRPIARIAPDASDDDSRSFVMGPHGGTPGRENF